LKGRGEKKKKRTVINKIRHAEEDAHADQTQEDHGVAKDAED